MNIVPKVPEVEDETGRTKDDVMKSESDRSLFWKLWYYLTLPARRYFTKRLARSQQDKNATRMSADSGKILNLAFK
jgi:hypothetical protein